MYTNDGQLEDLVVGKTTFTAITKKIKYLGINLPEMYKTYLKKTKL